MLLERYTAFVDQIFCVQIVATFVVSWGPVYKHMPSKVYYEITHPFPILNGCTVEVW